MRIPRAFAVALFAFAAPMLGATRAHAVQGVAQVVDENGKPVAGAFIVVKWTGSGVSLVHGHASECYSMSVVRTDADGKVRLPRQSQEGSGVLFSRSKDALVYVPGYSVVITWSGAVTRLKKSAELPLVRLSRLSSMVDTNCLNPKRITEFAPLLKSLNEEAQSLPVPADSTSKGHQGHLRDLYEGATTGVWPLEIRYRMKSD